jgi:hypothetical protein
MKTSKDTGKKPPADRKKPLADGELDKVSGGSGGAGKPDFERQIEQEAGDLAAVGGANPR